MRAYTLAHSLSLCLSPTAPSLSFSLLLSFSLSLFSLSTLRDSLCFARPRSLVLSHSRTACTCRRRISDVGEERHSRGENEDAHREQEGLRERGWMVARAHTGRVGGEHGARGDARAAAKRGHRRSSHYDNGDRRGVSAHP